MNIVDTLNASLVVDGIDHRYEYMISKTDITLFELGVKKEVQSYGIVVERRDIAGGKVISLERDSVENVSPQRHKVQALAKLLCENLVSPINFIDIIGEYIDEYTVDYNEMLKQTS